MLLFTCDRLSASYPALLKLIKETGEEVDSRIGRTKELSPATLVIDEPKHCIVSREGFNKDLLTAEITMLLAGKFDGRILRMASEEAGKRITARTAYGPRIKRQMINIEMELRENPDSRRAVVYVGESTDLMEAKGDVGATAGQMPCTCLFQFLVRDEALAMFVYMRSWDAVWGLSYDVPAFVSVQMALAKSLGLDLGRYEHVAGSLHLYEQHWNLKPEAKEEGELRIPMLGDTMEQTQQAAERWMWSSQNGLIPWVETISA
jgi:thymidylate synthase